MKKSKEIEFDIPYTVVALEEYDSYVYLSTILVKEGYRGRGLGSIGLMKSINYAKSVNKPLLAFVTSELGGNLEDLKRWYKRHGFYEESNKIQADYNYNHRKDC